MDHLVSPVRPRGPKPALDASVAKWAAGPFCIGDMTLRPWVIGPGQLEPITSIAKARGSIDLAFLSGMAHRDSPVAKDVGRALLGALRDSEDEQAGLYWDIFAGSIDKAVRRAIEMEFIDYVPQCDWARKHYFRGEARGKVKGRREGRQEGRQEGRREGEAKGRLKGEAKGRREGEAEAVLVLLKARRVRVTKAQSERIRSCRDLRRIRAWLRRAATATTAAEVLGDP